MSIPGWLDTEQYPFSPHFFRTDAGHALHYVDVGSGPAIVFVHGMPTWSFLWRGFVAALSSTHRCIAVDHLGFGLSDKPVDGDYHPRAQSENLSALIEHLGLDDVLLVVHDFGGPIGLAHAIAHPERVRGLVIFNTWMWATDDAPNASRIQGFVDSFLGRSLYRSNLSARWLIPTVAGRKLPWSVRRHYAAAVPSGEREGHYQTARHLFGASDWFASLWDRRDRLAALPVQLIWGRADPTVGDQLHRWEALFPHAQALAWDDVGHFPQEEVPEEAIRAVASFAAQTDALREYRTA